MTTSSTEKTPGTHKCPMCAEIIPILSSRCEYCGTQFIVTSSGYCQACHAVREADESGRCRICGEVLQDRQFSSTMIEESQPQTKKVASGPFPPSEAETDELVVLPIKGEGVNLRSSAVFLDVFLITLLYGIVLALILLVTEGLGSFSSLDVDSIQSKIGDVITFVLIPIIWISYFTVFEGTLGWTPGKLLSHLRVIKKGGGRINLGQALVRTLLGPLDYLLIGAIIIWVTPLKQRLGDLIAGTMVVNREKIHKAEFSPPAITLEFHDNRRVSFSQIVSGVIYKFGMVRELKIHGIPLPGSPKRIKIRGQFFRTEFKMLCRNIEGRYNLKFAEKIIAWRLVMVLLVVGAGILGVFAIINQFSGKNPTTDLPAILYTDTPEAVSLLPLTDNSQPTETSRPTATTTPTQTPIPQPLEVDFDTLAGQPLGQPVILVGRLTLFSSTFCSDTRGLLLENPGNPSQKVTIFIPVGDGNNQMKPLPDSYTKSDIQVRLDDGTLAVIGYRLRVTGEVCETTAGEPCISEISRLELFQVK